MHNKATSVYGVSAGHLPNQVSKKKSETKNQKRKRETGEYKTPIKNIFFDETEKINKNETEKTKPKTPPNLLGIERRIA